LSQSQGGSGVIDLTLDSDDEEPPLPKTNGKRKVQEHDPMSNDMSWNPKKPRLDALPNRPSLSNAAINYHNPSGSHGTAPVRYPSTAYQTASSQSGSASYPNRNPPQLPTPRLPGINALLPQGRWV
jgi:hypothetical protein